MTSKYLTIKDSAMAEYEISRSRFIAYLERVSSEAAAIEFIAKIKKRHWDARHHCYAYIIGEKSNVQKADDNGEPSGTAGKPMLEVLKKNELTDTIVVVTRYFGGIKLGAGGLIRAYGTAVTTALGIAEIVEKAVFTRVSITIDYSLLGTLENNLHLENYIIETKEFTDKVTLIVLVPKETASILITNLMNWTASRCIITTLNDIYREIPANINQ